MYSNSYILISTFVQTHVFQSQNFRNQYVYICTCIPTNIHTFFPVIGIYTYMYMYVYEHNQYCLPYSGC